MTLELSKSLNALTHAHESKTWASATKNALARLCLLYTCKCTDLYEIFVASPILSNQVEFEIFKKSYRWFFTLETFRILPRNMAGL